LAHRPSRFDRVWQIPAPGKVQRNEFISKLFQTPDLSENQKEHIVHQTRGWSMAYVQELKATAVVSAVQNNRDFINDEDIDYAISKLSVQFESGKKNHIYESSIEKVGFSNS
jgi:ATP-dependent 26S proteasome regulatory subunit